MNSATSMARLRQAILRIVAILCAAAVFVGLLGREEFFVGTIWAASRWPLLGLLAVSALATRRRAFAIPAAVLLTCALVEWTAIRIRKAEPGVVRGDASLDVLSFNLLFRGGNPPVSEKVLAATGADVIALQEVTPAWESRLAAKLKKRYGHQTWRSEKGTHGLAIVSRHPIGKIRYLFNQEGRSIAQCAEVRVPPRPVYFCNVHLSSPAKALWQRSPGGFARNAERRAREWERLSALIDEHATSPRRIIAGDLNTMPQDPLHRAITETWVDAWEWASEGALGATWPNLHRRTPVPLFRIDYVLVQGPIVPKRMSVLPKSGSDHRPIRVQVRL